MDRRLRAGVGLPLVALAIQACDRGPCVLTVDPAIEVFITDSVTGEPRAGPARGVVEEGTYSDSLQRGKGNYSSDGSIIWISRAAAHGRVGSYSVRVVAAGYLDWQRTGVRALESGYCGITTVTLHARLVPAP